jgi:hypothetical protein
MVLRKEVAMSMFRLFLASISLCLLAGCQSMHAPFSGGAAGTDITDPVYCPNAGNNCVIDVDVDPDPNCGTDCGHLTAFVIFVDPPAGHMTMIWRLVRTNAAKFTADGIVFEDHRFNCAPPPSTLGVSGDGRTFVCDNPHVTNGTGWKYTIKIKPPSGPTQSIDPWVVNR